MDERPEDERAREAMLAEEHDAAEQEPEQRAEEALEREQRVEDRIDRQLGESAPEHHTA